MELNQYAGIPAWSAGKRMVHNITPKIHGPGSLFHNALIAPPLPEKSNRQQFVRALVGERNIRQGGIVEFAPGRRNSIPQIPGFRSYALSTDEEGSLDTTAECFPYIKTICRNMADLPCEELPSRSCDIAIWNGAMLYHLIYHARESAERIEGLLSAGTPEESVTLRSIRGLYTSIREGGCFIEFDPFRDWLDIPNYLARLKLEIKGIEFIKRPDSTVSSFDIDYFKKKYFYGLKPLEKVWPLIKAELLAAPFAAMILST